MQAELADALDHGRCNRIGISFVMGGFFIQHQRADPALPAGGNRIALRVPEDFHPLGNLISKMGFKGGTRHRGCKVNPGLARLPVQFGHRDIGLRRQAIFIG